MLLSAVQFATSVDQVLYYLSCYSRVAWFKKLVMAASRKPSQIPLRDLNDLDDFQLPSKPRFTDPRSSTEMEKLGKGPVVPNTAKNTA